MADPTIREVTDAPLSIDSPRPAAVEAGLAMAGAEPFLNSISAETDRYKTLIPFVKKYNTRVVALSMDDSGMTDDMKKVWEVADGLIKRLEDDGVPPDHIFVDPLIRPVSTNGEYGMGALSGGGEDHRRATPRCTRPAACPTSPTACPSASS